ncbi:MAG: hypothetical protein GW947_00270 [Candidatus Pacebacteria bacterium]|nr:hypothetical protein [Candidatus Paceibacterota bacterium]
MEQFRSILRFLFQLGTVLCLLLLEYPLGAPLLTVTLCILWFSGRSWWPRFSISVMLSLAIALVFSFSWLGAFGFFLVSFWVVRKSQSQGWPQVLIGLFILVFATVITDRVSSIAFWQIVVTLGVITVFSKSSRRQLRQLWQQRKSHRVQL